MVDSYIAVQVRGLSDKVRKIYSGYLHTCALMNGGGVECWGDNASGQLGNKTYTSSTIPVNVLGLSTDILVVSLSWANHSCVVSSGDGVLCWGYNDNGQLGDGTTTNRNAPVEVKNLPKNIVAIALGVGYSCALTSDGTVKCWGWNSSGQLGNDTIVNSSTPEDVLGLPSNIKAIATGYAHTCALTEEGGVTCWGANDSGQLGDGTTTNRKKPVQVAGLNEKVVGIALGVSYSCALTEGGRLVCWGMDYSGQMNATPVTINGPEGLKQISAGGFFGCVLSDSVGAQCLGANDKGQLGDGTTKSRTTPVNVIGLPL
jgi:alpha-tubulin suppressor-like RCC1 family protein